MKSIAAAIVVFTGMLGLSLSRFVRSSDNINILVSLMVLLMGGTAFLLTLREDIQEILHELNLLDSRGKKAEKPQFDETPSDR